MMKFKPGI